MNILYNAVGLVVRESDVYVCSFAKPLTGQMISLFRAGENDNSPKLILADTGITETYWKPRVI